MEEKKPTRPWQYHLSTAVVLMFASALIVGANAIPRYHLYSVDNTDVYIACKAYGYPMTVYHETAIVAPQLVAHLPFEKPPAPWLALLVDVATAGAILMPLAVASEVIIRRREARKT